MGSGGYATSVPKWQKMEAYLIAKGVVPKSAPWPECTKRWFLGHGGGLDPVTGKLVHGTKLKRATERLIQILKARYSGLFRPNREKDELTYSIGTAEHCGRTRGKGAVPWVQGFPEWIDSYRSRRMRRQRGSASCSNMLLSHGKQCLNHKGEKKKCKRKCKRKSQGKCKYN